MRSLLSLCGLLLLLAMSVGVAAVITVQVTSTSAFVGDSANYTVTLINQTQVKQVTVTFSNWTNSSNNPFSTSSQMIVGSTTYTQVGYPNSMVFTLPSSVVGSTFKFTLTNMQNPSSTKPYIFNITINNGSSDASYQANLTCTSINNNSFATIGYSNTVGSTSNNLQLYLIPYYALMLNSSVLKITYDNTVLSLTVVSSSSYSIFSTVAGTVVLNKFQVQSINQLSVVVNIINPQASLTTTINCLFYLNDSGTYDIEALYNTITLQTIPFTTISTSSSFNYGSLASLAVTSTSPYVPVANGSTSAYTQITYNSTEIKMISTSNCISTSSTTCKFTYSSSYTVTSLQPQIGSFNSTTLTITSYTYFQSQFYPLCQSTLTLTYSAQILTPNANTSQCTSAIVGQSNSISLTANVSLVAAGDLVYIKGILGVPTTTAWTKTTISSTIWYYYTVTASNIATINTTTATITLPLAFNNPTYTLTSNSITALSISRAGVTYGSSTASLTVCPVNTGLAIITSSINSSKNTTYTPTTIQTDMIMQLYDYKAGDYIIFSFKTNTNGNNFIFASAYLGLSYSVSINGVTVTSSLINSSSIKLTLTAATLPTSTSPLLKVVFYNLANPPMVSTLSAQVVTYQSVSGGIKETLTTGNLSVSQNVLSYSASNLQLLANNTLTLSITNPYRNLTNADSSVSSTSLKITIPTQLNCSAVTNNSLTIVWNTGVITSLPTSTGTTTNLSVSLGTCYVSYFTGTINYHLSETYSNITSTHTSISIVNICGDGCYQCSGTICTACFNTTWANLSLLYNGVCYQNCPVNTFQTTGACTDCHPSCSSCTSSAYNNCTSCAPAFLNNTNYCLSVCGQGKYLSGSICLLCDLECTACISSTNCYVCKTNATMIGSTCDFTSCFSPCLTCSGVQSNCTACISSYSLYQFTCVGACPSGTYQSTSNGQSVCITIPQSSSYIPVTIVGIVGMLAIFALRVYSNKRIGNETRRSRNYQVQEEGSVNFKINVWRVGGVLFAYLQIIASIVLLLKDVQYGLSVNGASIVTIGLIIHLITNIAFIIGYYCIVSRNKVSNSEEQSQQNKNLSLRYTIILTISTIFTYRTYKLLYSNLFRQQKNADLRNTEKTYPNQDTYNPVSRLTATQPNPRSSRPTTLPQRNHLKQSHTLVRSKAVKQEEVASKKPLAVGVISRQEIRTDLTKPVETSNGMEGILLYFKRFNHPFLTYLTLSNLLVGSLLILIGSCLQMMSSTFVNMLFWGVDALIVTIFSIGLSSWDLWNFSNLTRDEQHSQMSSNNQANDTHENLKQAAQVQVQLADLNPKKSPKRSMVRPKLSNRTNKSKDDSKSKQDRLQQNQPIPMLKVFDDFEQKDDNVVKQSKTKKFSTKNLRYGNKLSKRNASISNTRKHLGQLCDDLYINFPSYNVEKENSTTSYFKSRRSASPPQRSVQEKEHSMEADIVVGDMEDDFEGEQPPNFQDISEIQQKKVDPNISELAVPEQQ